MRLVYGIHGYGRGHAMRALAVLPALMERHEVLILAGGEAYLALWPEFPVTRIPTLKYHYGKRSRISNYLTAKRNLSAVLDVRLGGPGLEMVMDILGDFRPEVVLTDSEPFTHRAAERMGIPRISFDHFGLLVYCEPEMSRLDHMICRSSAFAYSSLFGRPERAIVSSFFDAPPRLHGVRVVGPVIREEVRRTQPTNGRHLLVYLSKGESEYTPNIERALLALDCPVWVYGTPRRGLQDNLQFKPIANLPFIEDLASCRAVFATTGNQLCGEVLYFGKPMLGMPIACLEQRLNAVQIQRLGVGMQVRRSEVTAAVLKFFLSRQGEFARNARGLCRNGAQEAVDTIERFAAELVNGRGGSQSGVRTTGSRPGGSESPS